LRAAAAAIPIAADFPLPLAALIDIVYLKTFSYKESMSPKIILA